MSDDNFDNPLTNLDSLAQAYSGEPFNTEGMVQNFPRHGHDDRAAILVQFDQALDRLDTSDLRRYTRLTSLRERLDGVHRRLRSAGR
jgi:hypothetical protein